MSGCQGMISTCQAVILTYHAMARGQALKKDPENGALFTNPASSLMLYMYLIGMFITCISAIFVVVYFTLAVLRVP